MSANVLLKCENLKRILLWKCTYHWWFRGFLAILFCCHHLLARPTLGTNIGHFREKLNLFRDIAWTYLLPYYSNWVFGNVYLWAEQHYFCNVMGLKLRLKLRNRWLLQGASTIYFWLLGNSDSELSINLALFWGSLRSKGCSVLFYLLSILWHWWKAKSDQAKIQPSWRKFLNNFKHELLFAAATNWKAVQSCYISLSIVWHWWKAESDQVKIRSRNKWLLQGTLTIDFDFCGILIVSAVSVWLLFEVALDWKTF